MAVHIVIMGCGRVGSTLAHDLTARDISVAVVDRDKEAFRRLGDDFTGRTVTGVGFDRDTLTEAGIGDAAAFAAVSSGDNSNIISARVARETFGVENVVARIYDPRRAELYQRLGIPTVGTVRWTADQMMRRLLPEGAHSEWTDPSGKVALVELPYAEAWIGRKVTALEQAAGTRIVMVTRMGEALIPNSTTVVQNEDLLHVVVARADAPKVAETFAHAPEESA